LDLRAKDVSYEDDDGKTVEKSKYLFMVEYLSEFPSALVDTLFDAFTNMQTGLERKIREEAKFEHFILSEEVEEDAPEQFRKLNETGSDIPPEEMTEVDRLNQKVKDEINQEDIKNTLAENEALSK